ncbi:MAG: hypothetical protein GX434_00400 [Peptococcaceae bacterium]|nr:hypothetical protein [Peptococcaceae bacterium]
MHERILEILIFSIPEATVIFCLAFSLSDKKISGFQLAVMGVTLGILANLVRGMVESYILNICILSIITIFLLKILGKFSVYEAATSALTSISLYLIIEFLNVKSLQILTGINPTRLGEEFYLKVLWFLPQVAYAIVISCIIRYIISRQPDRE